MDSLVFVKVCFVIEAFPTVTTAIRLFASVSPLVGNEVRASIKLFPTQGTAVPSPCSPIPGKCYNADIHVLGQFL